MQSQPLISVCMLCYNHEKYVAQSIQSVIDQTYDNWELVITDNASTDSSRQIIEEYARRDSRIKLSFLDCNSYPSGGINNSIKYSNGEYLAMISADDYFMPNKLELQLELMLLNKLEISFTWVKSVDDNNQELFEHWTSLVFNQNFDKQLDLLTYFINKGNALSAVTAIISRRVQEEFGLYDNRLLQTQDFDLWLKIIKKYPITVFKEKLTGYRIRNDGKNLSVNSNQSDQFRGATEAIWFMQNICDLDADIISRALNRSCDDESKFRILFDYYLENNNKAYATATLLAMYNKLGANFSFPSLLYQDFLEIYSGFDMFDIIKAKELRSVQAELRTARAELESVYGSRSWKITKPLRKLLNLFL